MYKKKLIYHFAVFDKTYGEIWDDWLPTPFENTSLSLYLKKAGKNPQTFDILLFFLLVLHFEVEV